MMVALFIVTFIYIILILFFVIGFDRVKEFHSESTNVNTNFSIIVPFRNEEENLPNLLTSILQLQYPKEQFECLFVNDESDDKSVDTIHDALQGTNVKYKVIDNQRKSLSPKKDAIETAIYIAQFDWIITTDADCILPKMWLHEFTKFIDNYNSKMVVGPVNYVSQRPSFLENFQILDFLSLQGATVGGFGIGKPFLCNGANLAYQKETFLELNGFQGNNTIASGDDIFLFEKIQRVYPKQVHFLKSTAAIVQTYTLKTWKELINQRMRWAAKSSSYGLLTGKIVGFIVLLMNLAMIIAIIGFFMDRENSLNHFLIILLKFGIDLVIIVKTSSFYNNEKRVKDIGFGSLLYPFFSVFIILKTLVSQYKWKGRKFKK